MNESMPKAELQRYHPNPEMPQADAMLALVERAARDTTIDVEKMERLLLMAEKVQGRKAEAEYDAAMNACQSEMLPVANDSDNPQTRSRYASYGALDKAVRPIYTAHGFSLSFGTKSPGPDRVTITCRISHRAGHTERVEIDMPADGKGAKGGEVMTRTHATGSAVSYGMRYLLKMIFNIAVGEYDDDGNAASARPAKAPVSQPRQQPVQAAKTAPAANPAPATPVPMGDKKYLPWLSACHAKLLKELAIHGQASIDYAVAAGIIMEGEDLLDANSQHWFPSCSTYKTVEENNKGAIADMTRHRKGIEAIMGGEQVPENKAEPAPEPETQVADDDINSPDAAWRRFPVPFGKNEGTELGFLDRKALYGFWKNFEVTTEYNGRPKSPDTIARDEEFRTRLDEAGQHLGFK